MGLAEHEVTEIPVWGDRPAKDTHFLKDGAMSRDQESFNPYHEWLGIPLQEQCEDDTNDLAPLSVLVPPFFSESSSGFHSVRKTRQHRLLKRTSPRQTRHQPWERIPNCPPPEMRGRPACLGPRPFRRWKHPPRSPVPQNSHFNPRWRKHCRPRHR